MNSTFCEFIDNTMDTIFVPVKTLMGRLAPTSAKLSFTPDGLWKVSLKDEHRTSNSRRGLSASGGRASTCPADRIMNKKKNEIKLQNGATSLICID